MLEAEDGCDVSAGYVVDDLPPLTHVDADLLNLMSPIGHQEVDVVTPLYGPREDPPSADYASLGVNLDVCEADDEGAILIELHHGSADLAV